MRKCAILLPLVAAAALAQQRLYFVDEAALDASFAEFRAQLRKAVVDHNAAFVRSIIYPGIDLGSEADQGPESFERVWNLDSPKSELWDELGDLLALGGSFTDEHHQFCAPYVYSVWPKNVDREEMLAITGKDVRVHATCDTKAPVVAVLGHDLVTDVEADAATVMTAGKPTDPARAGWVRIETADGKKGCVRDEYVRSPLDYHACFEKIKGKWMMTLLSQE